MEKIVQNIERKIERLKREFHTKINFGRKAKLHEIEGFEKRFNLKLPPEFKYFVMHFGNGCGFEVCPFDFSVKSDESLTKPFPLTEGLTQCHELDDDLFKVIYDGQITVSAGGCGNCTFLVVNGPEYGNVWLDELPSNDEMIPFTCFDWKNRIQPGVRKNFLEWFDALLDLRIKQAIKRSSYNDDLLSFF